MEKLRENSKILHREVQSISRSEITETLNNVRITDPYYTKYEYVTLIGIRAKQIKEGARPLVSLDGFILSDIDFERKVAEKEIAEKVLSAFIIHRTIPNGKDEYWSASELNVIW